MESKNRNLTLTLKDVRCFAGEQHLDIRPLTFLVGENSTGKTTAMSCFSELYKLVSPRAFFRPPDFNQKPYSMGAFIDIVRKSAEKKSKAQVFEIGLSHNNGLQYNFCFTEKAAGSEPVVQKASVRFKDIFLCCETKSEKTLFSIKKNAKTITKNELSLPDDISLAWPITHPFFFRDFFHSQTNKQKKGNFKGDFDKILEALRPGAKESFSDNILDMAPIRSKPKRTYDSIKESYSPEGDEIPVFLFNLKTKDWEKIRKNLADFGKESDLFSDIEIRKFGKTKGDPFQLRFQVRGITSNFIDTGYGLSQILPILVRLFASNMPGRAARRGTRFLLQEPEIHLHPSALAEFASLLLKSAKANSSFLIETHSDYMLDRARIEISNGEISPDQVSIIYLEPLKKGGVKAHNMFIDKQGNLMGAPDGYRKFFIQETDRFLGFED